MPRSTWIAVATVALFLGAAEVSALACPSCALNHQAGGDARGALIAAMLVVPFVVAAAAFFAIRRALRR
ncbi:MAG TPA: hypothetical protein VFG83_01375 [Kofleriaceae bacterium]|nr:hypothetical protein [Kofleriaceae bacterium]